MVDRSSQNTVYLKVLVALCIDRSKKYQKIQNSVLHAFGCRAKFHDLC
jgi:hypothetical protein